MWGDDDREIRLRPRKPPLSGKQSKHGWSTLYKKVMRYARMTRKLRSRSRKTGVSRGSRLFSQRCAVRVTYSRNAVKGQWKAHGRYVARESAAHEIDPKSVGFDRECESIDMSAKLSAWQTAGDERLWKVIISPEFGDRVDLKRLARDVMSRVDRDLGGGPLEWIAVAHYNTGHPHVHVALRGADSGGRPLTLDRDFVKSGIRTIAENLCTQQLGYRSEFDAAAAERHEVSQHRFTSLDRIINRPAVDTQNEAVPGFFTYAQESLQPGIRDGLVLRQQHVRERLVSLQKMGLAECVGPNRWIVRHDFEEVLRAMQRVTDRQKTLAAHGVVMSDERLTVATLEYRNLKSVEGRVLVHGEEEAGREAGRSYLMLEGTDARVHHIYYTPEMEEARNHGKLRTNSFVRLRKLFVDGEPVMEIDDLGDSEAVLTNKSHLRQTARSLIKCGVIPEEDGWGGWLGRYQAALRNVALDELDRDVQVRHRVKHRERVHSHGR